MSWFRKKTIVDIPKILIRKIDDLIVLSMDNELLERKIFSHEENVYLDILEMVERLRSGLVTDDKEYAKLKMNIRVKMNSRKSLEQQKRIEHEERISKETFDLARGTDEDQRQSDALRITSVVDEFEHDEEGLVYLKGNSIPMPRDLVKKMVDALFNPKSKYTFDSLVSFWNWAILNPNPEARKDLFGWFDRGSFTITSDGMIVAYRCVNIKKLGKSHKLEEFVTTEYARIKKSKKSPHKYGVLGDFHSAEVYERFVMHTNPELTKDVNFLGTVADLYDEIIDSETAESTIYTDNHTGTMEIQIGSEAWMNRRDCDEDRHHSCSKGLHFMSKEYSLRYGNVTIIILVNPMNVVAFPAYDNTKGRCSRYLPVAHASIDPDTGDFEDFDAGTIDFSYSNYSKERLEKQISNYGFDTLIETGEISNEITADEFAFIKEEIKARIENRFVEVE